ncbi:MAG: PTS sugar transporter subunit IIA [Deltaproteobacteria bacterium]|nr:PTS sugar transporter subunit IIA [Deltaproteobacteria bacterium]
MKLGVKQVAALLEVSEKTVYRWISRSQLPGHKVGAQYRFNRAEVLEWSIVNKIPVSPDILIEDEDVNVPPFHESLRKGGIFYRVNGNDVRTVLEQVIGLMSLPDEVDRDFLLQVLLARESMGSTGVGNGIAIPHTRNPIVMHIVQPLVSLCFLENLIDFNAIDGRSVHTLFTIVSPSSRAHLQLLSKLSFALRKGEFAKTVENQTTREEILSAAEDFEHSLAGHKSGCAGKRATGL